VRERPVDEHADVVLARVGQHLGLDVATEEVVGGLQCLHRADAGKLGHLIGGEVRDADVADLTLVDQLLKGARRLLEGGRGSGQCTW
jgi:hypothetical protein